MSDRDLADEVETLRQELAEAQTQHVEAVDGGLSLGYDLVGAEFELAAVRQEVGGLLAGMSAPQAAWRNLTDEYKRRMIEAQAELRREKIEAQILREQLFDARAMCDGHVDARDLDRARAEALHGPPEGPHLYLSTACWHAQADLGSPEDAARLHGYCSAYTGQAGGKTPAKCKWCEARCSCECHTAVMS